MQWQKESFRTNNTGILNNVHNSFTDCLSRYDRKGGKVDNLQQQKMLVQNMNNKKILDEADKRTLTSC